MIAVKVLLLAIALCPTVGQRPPFSPSTPRDIEANNVKLNFHNPYVPYCVYSKTVTLTYSKLTRQEGKLNYVTITVFRTSSVRDNTTALLGFLTKASSLLLCWVDDFSGKSGQVLYGYGNVNVYCGIMVYDSFEKSMK